MCPEQLIGGVIEIPAGQLVHPPIPKYVEILGLQLRHGDGGLREGEPESADQSSNTC